MKAKRQNTDSHCFSGDSCDRWQGKKINKGSDHYESAHKIIILRVFFPCDKWKLSSALKHFKKESLFDVKNQIPSVAHN